MARRPAGVAAWRCGAGALVDGRPQPKTMTVSVVRIVNGQSELRGGGVGVIIRRLSGSLLDTGLTIPLPGLTIAPIETSGRA